MIVTITVEGPHGPTAYTGHVVSRTDHTITMLLTDPYERAGHSVNLNAERIVKEEVVVR